MAKTQYLTFYVNLTDQDRVAALQAQFPQGETVAPLGAADQYAAPFKGYTAPTPGVQATWTPWSGIGSPDGTYPIDRVTFTRKSGGWFGIPLLFGSTTKYIWVGQHVYTTALAAPTNVGTPAVVEDPVERVAIPLRRWIDGAEFPGIGVPSSLLTHTTRIGSRVLDGLGYSFHNKDSSARSRVVNENISGFTTRSSWERLYITPFRYPDAGTGRFWRCNGAVSTGGAALELKGDGRIGIFRYDAGGAFEIGASPDPIPLYTRVKIDLLINYAPLNSPNNVGRLRVYLNGKLVLEWTTTVNAGLGQAQDHLTSDIGVTSSGPLANGSEIAIDDWICADIPNGLNAAAWAAGTAYVIGNQATYLGKAYRCVANNTGNVPPNKLYWIRQESLDWVSGSHVQLVRGSGLAASHSGYTGDWRALLQNPTQSDTITGMTSATGGARIGLTTDAVQSVKSKPGFVGVASMHVARYGQRSVAGPDGAVGYSLAGAAAVLTTIVGESSSLSWVGALYRGPNTVAPIEITPLEIYYQRAAGDTQSATIRSLFAAVELIGVFGTEDIAPAQGAASPAAITIPLPKGLHNAPYPRSPWAMNAAPPQSPVAIFAGTYVGSGANKEITFPLPIHWWWVRPLTADSGGTHWWSTMVAAHQGARQSTYSEQMPLVEEDLTFVPTPGQDQQQSRYIVRMGGSHSQSNANAIVYQYLAVSDPGQRFMTNGAWRHLNLALGVNPLAIPDFTPEAAWLFLEEAGGGTSTSRFYFKGLGHAVDTAQLLDAAEATAHASFGAGLINSFVNLHVDGLAQVAFCAWRRSDGSADPGIPRVVQLYSYTGNGIASRTFPLLPLSGRRPMFAMVMPHNGAAYFRDPSHTGTNSSTLAGGSSATAITGGGLDEITVGTTLNTNAVIYDVFVLPGSTTAGNGGWSINEDQYPIEPDYAPGGGWKTPPVDPDTVVVPPVTGPTPIPPDDITTDLATACEPFSRRIVNVALSRIGISRPIANLATEFSEAAEQARLHYGLDVGVVLRDFAWPFATRYAALTLVAGTTTVPANEDWQYSYRAPVNMLYARRIVGTNLQQRRYDPLPIEFRPGSDATGTLIYSNEPIGSRGVYLEYTIRLDCPASSGTPDFRSALAWRLGASLSLPLAKDKDRAVFCEQMYRVAIETAETNAANEQQQAPGGDADWISGR